MTKTWTNIRSRF